MDYKDDCQEKSDSELVELAKENPDYFGCLMRRYEKQIFSYVRRISYFEKEDIEDLLQEIFLKVYKNLNDYEDSLKFSSWLYRIARNQTIDEFRKRKSRPRAVSLEDAELVKILHSSSNIEKEIDQKRDLEKAKKIISDLPLKYRDILILRFIEEKNYEEIMDILKKPKGTVASLIQRGKKLLEKALGKS